MSRTVEEIYKELSKDFPAEAMTKDSSRGFALTSIKAQYVRERLNEVMGVNGWSSNTDVVNIDDDGNVAVKYALTLHFDQKSITRSAFGGAAKKEKGQTHGDVFKSAETDAMSKAASNFGIGNSVFKGLVDANNLGAAKRPTQTTAPTKSKSTFNRRKKSTSDSTVEDDI